MKLPAKTKLIGGVVSAIVIGAVGSGVWQYIMEPALSASSRIILELATLGVESFKNELYREIAKGFHEEASSALYFEFNLSVGITLIAIPVFLVIVTKESVDRKSAMMEELQRIGTGKDKNSPSIDDLRKELLNIRPERLLKFFYALVVVGLIISSAQFVVAKRDRYVYSAVTHYFQLKRIVSPYIDLKEMNVLDSQFAQVESAKDYKAVISKMRNIAKQNSVQPPKFEIWE